MAAAIWLVHMVGAGLALTLYVGLLHVRILRVEGLLQHRGRRRGPVRCLWYTTRRIEAVDIEVDERVLDVRHCRQRRLPQLSQVQVLLQLFVVVCRLCGIKLQGVAAAACEKRTVGAYAGAGDLLGVPPLGGLLAEGFGGEPVAARNMLVIFGRKALAMDIAPFAGPSAEVAFAGDPRAPGAAALVARLPAAPSSGGQASGIVPADLGSPQAANMTNVLPAPGALPG
eukprot:CAMPEP_0168378430 /NCGR_PEP_ID=MMETSP0228-20121227/11333_1 /TAXON_ID=133427 /ORGANISM="Protoceratium reticulatum, Strain CCCM 535 (=CCMP 1889)" /LENGTH=226 /DNA_ID=CAMNT_0008391449 /DNA_START=312 /DNA_END=990 /DNA_ORIENTATION=+